MVHPEPDQAADEVVVLFQHVPFRDKAIFENNGRRGTGTGLLPARAVGEKIFPLERHQAMDVME